MGEASLTKSPVVGFAGFTRALAAAGISESSDGTAVFVAALREVNLASVADVYWCARATLCRIPDQIPLFDAVFESWFNAAAPITEGATRRLRSATSVDNSDGVGEDLARPQHVSADDTEILRSRDIAEMTEDERAQLARMIAALIPRRPVRRSQRLRPAPHGKVDVSRSVRDILRAGGESVRLRHQRRSTRPRRVVLLIDVSGSMSKYSDALLRFAHVIVRAHPASTEVFSVGTRLTRLSRPLRSGDAALALATAERAVPDWDGGTRLGEALRVFLDRWGRKGLARGAVVVICSDGWEGGDVADLAEQMDHLRRLCTSVIWVNPHAGAEGYAPVQSGIVAVLPYVDSLIAGHSVAAFAEVLTAIEDV